ncbi:MAG: hypothetical protein NT068_01300 [Candidatus Nomurabacteria bacterium]|nr:hypothetical protein [Candidatus Nomurabacteria bacterium]
MLIKIISVALLFLGESLAIYTEVIAAHSYQNNLFWSIFIKMFILMTIAGGLLVAGYMFAFKGFKDIWIVSVISITSILFMEPIINYLIFHELPSRGTAIGFIFGILGLVSMVIF